MSGETYIAVRCRIIGIRPASVFVAVDRRREVNIPRTLIHGADETGLDRLLEGAETTLRIMTWKCKELGLTATPDTTTANLFASFEGEG